MKRSPNRVKAAGRKSKILIVDDHSVVREGLSTVINQEPDLAVCGVAENASEAMTSVSALKPDAAIVDLSLEGRNGLDLVKDFKARHPQLRVMVLSMHDEALYAERALQAGAHGYIMKKESTRNILAALRHIIDGGVYASGRVTENMMQRVARHGMVQPRTPVELLSDRELEVFELLGEGLTTHETADKLHLSMKTVSCYRQNIKAKLNLKTAAELVRYAVHWAKTGQTDQAPSAGA